MSLSFLIFAVTLFFIALTKPKKDIKATIALSSSLVLFCLAFYAYHGIKFFIPVFVLALFVLFFKDLWSRKKAVLTGIGIGMLVLLPLIGTFLDPQTRLRLGAVNIFSQNTDIVSESSQRLLYHQTHSALLGQVFDNRRTLLGLEVVKSYLSNYDPTWLFTFQNNKSFQLPDFGPLHLFELPLLLLGIVALIKLPILSTRIKFIILIWVLAAPLSSAFSTEAPQLNRSNPLLPSLIIIEAFGMSWLLMHLHKLKNQAMRVTSYTTIGVIIGISFLWLLHAYFVTLPYNKGEFFQDGARQALAYAKTNENHYNTIIVSNSKTLLQSYMYYLFFDRYDPVQYQRSGGTGSGFFTSEHFIGKYKFLDFPLYYGEGRYKKEVLPGKTLYITNPDEIPISVRTEKNIKLLKKLYFENGEESLWILEQEDAGNLDKKIFSL